MSNKYKELENFAIIAPVFNLRDTNKITEDCRDEMHEQLIRNGSSFYDEARECDVDIQCFHVRHFMEVGLDPYQNEELYNTYSTYRYNLEDLANDVIMDWELVDLTPECKPDDVDCERFWVQIKIDYNYFINELKKLNSEFVEQIEKDTGVRL